jgi:hypothetical protein|tara:strand:+ start:5473 stop:5661 length:189 start_codon:yes stop_codon:yes gene_type:complete
MACFFTLYFMADNIDGNCAQPQQQTSITAKTVPDLKAIGATIIVKSSGQYCRFDNLQFPLSG